MDLIKRKRKPLLILAAISASTYTLYKLYHSPSITRKRQTLSTLTHSLISLSQALSSSSHTITLLSSDLNLFLTSTTSEIPNSLIQLSKLASSPELSSSLSSLSHSITLGISKGLHHSETQSPAFTDRVLDKLFTNSGSGFASIVVGSFARNLVLGLNSNNSGNGSSWVEIVLTDKYKIIIASYIEKFVGTAVAVFLDKTMDVNTYDEFFAGLTNPSHEAKVKELFVTVCNSAVETLIKTSHEVIVRKEEEKCLKKEGKNSGWFKQVGETLAVESNRRFVLDVTGRVTFETVRSFLEFVLWKVYDGGRRSASGVVERGMEVVRYFSAKSMLAVTVCFALCMHLFSQTRVLVPA